MYPNWSIQPIKAPRSSQIEPQPFGSVRSGRLSKQVTALQGSVMVGEERPSITSISRSDPMSEILHISIIWCKIRLKPLLGAVKSTEVDAISPFIVRQGHVKARYFSKRRPIRWNVIGSPSLPTAWIRYKCGFRIYQGLRCSEN